MKEKLTMEQIAERMRRPGRSSVAIGLAVPRAYRNQFTKVEWYWMKIKRFFGKETDA